MSFEAANVLLSHAVPESLCNLVPVMPPSLSLFSKMKVITAL